MASSSAARSKFLTYSLYIFRKGASFWITSPMRGVADLREGRPGMALSLKTCSPTRQVGEARPLTRQSSLPTALPGAVTGRVIPHVCEGGVFSPTDWAPPKASTGWAQDRCSVPTGYLFL